LIRIEDLVKTYGEGDSAFTALHGASFHIPKGEFAAIMGPSGCGKSTLLNILGVMDRPTRGEYHLAGDPIAGLEDAERTYIRRRRIGFVFQSFNLLPRMTAHQNVMLPMGYEGVPLEERRARAHELLRRVGLKGKDKNTPLEMSGGECQRVGIARALANKPDVLLADEPTGNLDSKTAIEIMALFHELHKEGMTLLLVTHDRTVADASQHILHFKDGLLVREEHPQ
jgi:putative ABC transport system ATP-binding protein